MCWAEIFQRCHLPVTHQGIPFSQSKHPLGSITEWDRLHLQVSGRFCFTGHTHTHIDLHLVYELWCCLQRHALVQSSLRAALNLMDENVLLNLLEGKSSSLSCKERIVSTRCYLTLAGCPSIIQALADMMCAANRLFSHDLKWSQNHQT